MNENEVLRYLLWLNHGHFESLYGDDGELQCGKCRLDFKRDSIEIIKKRFDDMAFERLIEYAKSKEGKCTSSLTKNPPIYGFGD